MKKPLVAIVDDDSAFSSYLRTFLSLRGYETRAYSRGDEMLAAIRQGDPPDIVLLDVMMPGMDGLETLRNLKAARPELQAIMLSGRERASTIVEAVQLGAANYVIKPDDPEGLGEVALEAAIKSAIEKSRLVSELNELRQQLSDDQDRAVWGRSERMVAITRLVEQVADSDVTVLIRGESGVGKELVARAVHQNSSRRPRSFVKVNCAALPADLLESELFGHEKGAFTGAATTRIGKFEQADGGTIFMDEIAEMKPALQAKLLHVLQDAEFTKLGSNKRVTVDVRVVAATNRDLEAMMLKGDFREDLYYRLKVIDVHVPPLRERRDEIDPLTEFFIARYARRYNRPARPLSDMLRQQFHQYRLARQRARAREHDQARCRSPGRIARDSGTGTRTAAVGRGTAATRPGASGRARAASRVTAHFHPAARPRIVCGAGRRTARHCHRRDERRRGCRLRVWGGRSRAPATARRA